MNRFSTQNPGDRHQLDSDRNGESRYFQRTGATTILVLFLVIVMFMMAVFAVDYGYLLVIRTDLQRASDKAALAAVQDLIPDSNGFQDTEKAKATVREYAAINLGEEDFQVPDADIQIGRYDPESVYSGFTILETGVHDTVRVTLRRNDLNNSSIALYLARLIGIDQADVAASSTAILQKGRFLPPGADVLPIAIPQSTWNNNQPGSDWSIYGDGRLLDNGGNPVPGNWGTLDIGATSNSTNDLKDQILNGLRQSDLDSLAQAGTIPVNTHIDGDVAMWLNGDPGFSAGMKDSIRQSHGKTKLVPIFDNLNAGNGGNLDFHVVGWGVIEIVDSRWQGNKNSWVLIRRSYSYDGDLRPSPDLGATSGNIEAVYTSPVLVQ